MNVIVFTKYDTLAASSRHRFAAYTRYLAEHGIHLTLSPLFDDAYLEEKFQSGRAPILPVLGGFVERVKQLMRLKRWDLVLLQYELFPYFPASFESFLSQLGVPYVVDYDDAIFHMYDEHRNGLVRALLSGKIARVMKGAETVIAGSEYLARYARRHNDNVCVIPTVIDLDHYRVKDGQSRNGEPFTIGWIGSPSTAPYLDLVKGPLSTFGKDSGARLLVIGAQGPQIEGMEVLTHPWSEETEVELLLKCDVGIMPLPDENWARGKCAFKLIQYMACGLPVIASPVGANSEVVLPEAGVLASTPAEWLEAFSTLADDGERRTLMGRTGREVVGREYSVQSQRARFRDALLSAAHR